jgi:hypothetical protein
VRDQQWAAEGAITILPKRSSIKGKIENNNRVIDFLGAFKVSVRRSPYLQRELSRQVLIGVVWRTQIL